MHVDVFDVDVSVRAFMCSMCVYVFNVCLCSVHKCLVVFVFSSVRRSVCVSFHVFMKVLVCSISYDVFRVVPRAHVRVRVRVCVCVCVCVRTLCFFR